MKVGKNMKNLLLNNMEDNKCFEHYKFIADDGQNPLRVDKYLQNFVEFATRSKIQQAVKAGNVKVNNIIVKSNYKVKGNCQQRSWNGCSSWFWKL